MKGQCIRSLLGHLGPVWAMVRRKNMLVSVSQDKTVFKAFVINYFINELFQTVRQQLRHLDACLRLALSQVLTPKQHPLDACLLLALR